MARTLNILLRNDLALKLAIQAVSRHGPALGRLAKHLKKDHTAVYVARLRTIEPDITIKRWEDLIQKGLVRGYSGSNDLMYTYIKQVEGKEDVLDTKTFTSGYLATFSSKDPMRLLHQRFIKELDSATGFSALLSLMYRRYLVGESHPRLLFRTPSQPGLPYVQGAGTLDHTIPAEAKLIEDYQAITARLHRILTEGWAYLEQCLELLNACKTDKHLEDLFPEAAKLLPPPIKSSGSMVPVELAAKVRKMLETGVPAE
jgi:hypothetical protein